MSPPYSRGRVHTIILPLSLLLAVGRQSSFSEIALFSEMRSCFAETRFERRSQAALRQPVRRRTQRNGGEATNEPWW